VQILKKLKGAYTNKSDDRAKGKNLLVVEEHQRSNAFGRSV